jgi:aminoglycoside phosphotransferase (APT) family kinase protein
MPRRELQWVLDSLGPAASIVRAIRINRSTSVELTAIDVDHRGVRRKLVLRRYVNEAWLTREPDLATREAAVLRLLEHEPLRTPRLVAVAVDGRAAGAPSLLMARLPGREAWNPPSIPRLAEVGAAIHAVTAPRGFRHYRRYASGQVLTPPPSSKRPQLWERAFEVADAVDVDERPTCFIHRDHHAGNVLWAYGRVSGVVDWVEACIGPPAVDTARCRLNLVARAGGLNAARAYARCDGVVVDPRWDVVDAVDVGGSGLRQHPSGLRAVETFLSAALAELG